MIVLTSLQPVAPGSGEAARTGDEPAHALLDDGALAVLVEEIECLADLLADLRQRGVVCVHV